MEIFVTRNCKFKKVTCATLDLSKSLVPTTEVFSVNRRVKEADILKYLRKQYETETHKIAAIIKIEIVEEMRRMSEDVFMEHSEPMPEKKNS